MRVFFLYKNFVTIQNPPHIFALVVLTDLHSFQSFKDRRSHETLLETGMQGSPKNWSLSEQ